MFLNCPVTSQDVSLAEDILGPCDACVQGKATQAPHPPSVVARASVIGERVYVDFAFVSKLPFLVTLDEASNCNLTYDLQGSHTTRNVTIYFSKLLAAYQAFGHTIRAVYCDSEAVFLSLEVYLNSRGIQLFHSLPGRHCSLDQLRSAFDQFDSLFRTCCRHALCRRYLFLYAAVCCNLVPTSATGGRSPREIFTGVKLDVGVYLAPRGVWRLRFGQEALDFCQAA